MDQPNTNLDHDSNGPERRLDAERGLDAAGYWFLAAVLFAFIAAGVIVYRAGNAELQTAANTSSHPAAQTDRMAPPRIAPR